MRPLFALLFCFILAIANGATKKETPPPRPSAKEIKELYAWLDRLPIPDVKGLKYIRIWDGGTTGGIADTSEGFLLKDEGATFQVVLRDRTVARFEKAGIQPNDANFVGYSEISFEDDVRKFIARMATKEDAESRDDFLDRLGRTGQAVLITRLCATRGHPELADALFAKLGTMRQIMPNSHASEPLQEELQGDFLELLRWNAMRTITHQDFSRRDLLARYQEIERLCPLAEFYIKTYLRPAIELLETQVKVDGAHPVISDAAFAAMSNAQKAAELAFRLRDETVHTTISWPYAYDDPYESFASNGAYAGLVALGFDAVPALIEALDQKGDTRSLQIERHRNGPESIHEMAISALNDIAGINFYWGLR